MRLTPLMLRSTYLVNNQRPRNGRRPTRHPFPFNGQLPIYLRDKVSGKGDKEKSNPCLQEMAVLFACLKNNDFVQSMCSKEISLFQSCHMNYMENQRKKKDLELKGLFVPGEKSLTHKQVNNLLKKNPQPK